MQRRSRLMLVVASGFALVTAACGGGSDSSTETEAPAPVESAAPATEAAPEPAAETDPPATEEVVEEEVEETVAAEANEASDVGVTEDTIKIGVAIADLAAVRAAGISIPDTLTSEHLFDRWKVYADKWNADGGINGRQVELVQVLWDPLDQASFDQLCAEATVDQELFMMLNGTGLSSIAMQCLSDAGMFIMYGDVASQALLDAGLFISLAPSASVTGAAGAEGWVASGEVAAGAKVGVLSNNTPTISAAGTAVSDVLTEAGYDVEVIELNSVGADNAAINEESAAAVGTFQANGIEHVFVTTPFTENGGFWGAAASAGLPYTMLDTASSQCSAFGLSRSPAEAGGSECVTAFDHPGVEGEGVRADTEFEAECRAFFDENFSDYYGGPSNTGVPAGQKITDADGKVLISDYAPQECTISNILFQALTNGGQNPTRESVYEAALALGEVPFALGSGGSGTLAPDKPYVADKLHTIRITVAGADVKAGADGTYNGCPAPVNCGVVVSDWTPIG